ncbi:MAG: 5-oxoprolinase subunit PxpB [Luteolibacter sp.]
MEARVEMLGDSAWLVQWSVADNLDDLLHHVHAFMHTLQQTSDRPSGIHSILAAYDSLAVRYDPLAADGHAIREWIVRSLDKPTKPAGRAGELHEIPVCYGGEYGQDLCAVANACGITTEQVVSIHSATEYTVAMMGFAPGFPYLTGLDEKLRVPRLATPRNRVRAGSVAIAGEQAGIYPCDSPGGWHILGHTPIHLFDPHREDAPSLLKPGDRVKFIPATASSDVDTSPQWPGHPARSLPSSSPTAEILDPGFSTTIQDLGRPHFESTGVSPGGALDRQALEVANLLLGNPPDAAALEISVKGPTLQFHQPTRIVLVGADSSVGLRHARVRHVSAGETLETGTFTNSLRAILAIAGGIEIPEVMGSRSTDVRAGFGGLRLQIGDTLHTALTNHHPPLIDGTSLATPVGRDHHIRYLPGPQADWFTPQAQTIFQNQPYEVTTRQDRMGMRLHGEKLDLLARREMRSQPVCTGSIQIPPDGRPMILFAERQTHGGYPQIGCVITADLPKLARALPGTRIHFHPVTLEDAWLVMETNRRDLQWLKAGFMCHSASA